MDIEAFLDRENLQRASLSKRTYAFFIDSFLLMVLAFIIHADLLSGLTPESTDQEILAMQMEVLKVYLPMTLAYQWLFVTMYGATVGKMVMKIRIIDLQTGDNPSVGVSLNRASVRIISELVMNLGFLWAFFDPDRQAWHDKSARTLVIDV